MQILIDLTEQQKKDIVLQLDLETLIDITAYKIIEKGGEKNKKLAFNLFELSKRLGEELKCQ